MGTSASSGPELSDATVSSELLALGDSTTPLERKTRAFLKLRAHFCRPPSAQEKIPLVAGVDAQRYALWPKRPADASSLPLARLADRVRGLVFGAALGDATGLATEFLSREDVTSFYGDGFGYAPRPSKMKPDTHRIMWCPGDWTDDTDQLILIMQSLLHCHGRFDAQDFAGRLVAWRHRGFEELGDASAAGLGQHTKAVVQRDGFTADPIRVAENVWRGGGCKNAANGAVMRTAITGVPQFWDRQTVVANTVGFCRATHADPRCVASSVAVAACVSELLRGAHAADPAGEAAAAVAVGLAVAEGSVAQEAGVAPEELARAEECVGGLRQSVAQASGPLRDMSLDEPRTIGYTFKCLSASLWALQSEAGFAAAIRELVAEGGDADTNAAVAGALLGCRIGFSGLPSEWVSQLEHGSWLEAHVQKVLFMLELR